MSARGEAGGFLGLDAAGISPAERTERGNVALAYPGWLVSRLCGGGGGEASLCRTCQPPRPGAEEGSRVAEKAWTAPAAATSGLLSLLSPPPLSPPAA